jgi:hypothetical protein
MADLRGDRWPNRGHWDVPPKERACGIFALTIGNALPLYAISRRAAAAESQIFVSQIMRLKPN